MRKAPEVKLSNEEREELDRWNSALMLPLEGRDCVNCKFSHPTSGLDVIVRKWEDEPSYADKKSGDKRLS